MFLALRPTGWDPGVHYSILRSVKFYRNKTHPYSGNCLPTVAWSLSMSNAVGTCAHGWLAMLLLVVKEDLFLSKDATECHHSELLTVRDFLLTQN